MKGFSTAPGRDDMLIRDLTPRRTDSASLQVFAPSFNRTGGWRAPMFALSLGACSSLNADHQTPFADTLLASGESVPVVLSASRLRQPVDESPASVTIIDRDLIRLSGARSLVDVLMLVPGFLVGYRLRGNPVAAYHGIAQRYNAHLQLIIDGRPTYVPLYGGVPWHEMPIALEDVERIEITRAPNAATFGPNSFSTVISVTTREPAVDAGWRGSLEGGGNDYLSGTLTWHGSHEATDYRFTLQGSDNEGYENLPDTARARLLTLRAEQRLNESDRVIFDVGALQGGHIELDPVEIPEDFAPYEETTNLYGQLVWERAYSADDSWRLQYYYNQYDVEDDSEVTVDLGEFLMDPEQVGIPLTARFDRDTESVRHEVELQRTQRISDTHRVAYGFGLRQDTIAGRYVFNDDETHRVDTERLFGHSEFELNPKVLLQGGVLAEHNSLSGTAFAPRASATYRSAPGQRFRLGYSRGLRTPQLIEEEGEIAFDFEVGDETRRDIVIYEDGKKLDPETNDVYDIGYHYSRKDDGRTLAFDAKLSHQRIRGLLSNRQVPLEEDTYDGLGRAFENRFDYTWNTIDLELDYQASQRLRFRAAYAYSFGIDARIKKFNLTPKHTLALFASYNPVPSVSLSSEFYYVSEWKWGDEPKFLTNIERLDLRVAKRLSFRGVDAEVSLQAELELGENADYVERNDVRDQYFAKVAFRLP